MSHCWTELDQEVFHQNIALVKAALGHARLILVVKSNAYGHGVSSIVASALKAGVNDYAVTHVDEGMAVRERAHDAFILLLGVTAPSDVSLLLEHELTPVTVSLQHAAELSREAAALGKSLPVHVKIDTGMGRLGLNASTALKELDDIMALPSIEVNAVCSHLACADRQNDPYTEEQVRSFKALITEIRHRHPELEAHLANSDGLNMQDGLQWDAVRCGLLVYGYTSGAGIDVKPCLSWKSRVLQVKELAAGSHVGYGATWKADHECRIAVCDLGYADGYFRADGSAGRVLINGRACELVGRVSMNYLTVLLPDDLQVSFGDEVVLIGQGGGECITAVELAQRAGTIPYEVLTGIRCSDG